MGHVFETLPRPIPSPPRVTNFSSSSSVPKMDLSRPTLRAIVGGIYRMLFPSGFRPSLPSRPPSLSLGVYSLFSRHNHCHHSLFLPAYIGRFPFPAKRRWRYGRNFVPLAGHKPNTTKIIAWANQLEGIRNHDQIHNLRIQRLALKNEMRTLYGTLKKAKPADPDRYRQHAAVVKELS